MTLPRLLVLGALLVVLGAAASINVGQHLRAPINEGRPITVLLIGGDDGPFRGGSVLRSRADAMHLLVISPDQSRVTFLNIPRDSWVNVPGRGNNRINACLLNGPERCVQTVEALWGINVDHYVLTDFNGFRTAVNRFGGLEVDVRDTVRDGGEAIGGTGVQRINGEQALAYARDRKNRSGGDFGRSAAQTRLLRAAHRELFDQPASAGRVAEVVGIVQQTTITDLRTDELLRYGYLAMTIDPGDIAQVTLPARMGRAGSAAVVFLTDEAHRLVRQVTSSGTLPGG